MAAAKQWHENVCSWLLSALSVQRVWLNAHTPKHAQQHTHTPEHTQSNFSAVHQIWVYSSLVLSIYSRVHLGEPKLIEAHHNGLFISYWTDRPTPSLSLTPLSLLSHSAADMKRDVESVWCRTASAWLWGPQGHLSALKMDSESSFLIPLGWRVCFTPTHTQHIYTNPHKPWYTSKLLNWLCFISLSFSISNCPFSPFFFLLLDIFKSSNSHTTE